CLYGSEPFIYINKHCFNFLSCLYGSEPVRRSIRSVLSFLSCLYGSELERNHAILLLANKIINLYA
ncbi:hypothetical protein, partial [Enterobacter cloacae]|uniref:hypothetical protein n=1 Tax=Enterobacter cloacae TaxID=550 RepID=UPI001C686BAA